MCVVKKIDSRWVVRFPGVFFRLRLISAAPQIRIKIAPSIPIVLIYSTWLWYWNWMAHSIILHHFTLFISGQWKSHFSSFFTRHGHLPIVATDAMKADPPRHCRGTMEFNPAVASCMGMSNFWRLSLEPVGLFRGYLHYLSNPQKKMMFIKSSLFAWPFWAGEMDQSLVTEPWWNQWNRNSAPLKPWKTKVWLPAQCPASQKKHQKPLEVCWISAGMSRLAFQKSQPFNKF